MMLPLFKDNDAFDIPILFISDLRNGRLPSGLRPYILRARLLSLIKYVSPKSRPVAVGECFYRLVTSLAIA